MKRNKNSMSDGNGDEEGEFLNSNWCFSKLTNYTHFKIRVTQKNPCVYFVVGHGDIYNDLLQLLKRNTWNMIALYNNEY